MKFTKARHLLSFQIFTALCGFLLAAGQSVVAEQVTLEDPKLLVAFDRDSGALTRLEDKSTGWIIERRPELGISFRLHAPLLDRRDKVSENKVVLKWKNLMSEHGGVLPMTFTATVTLEDGTLTFDGALENDSALIVETIDYP